MKKYCIYARTATRQQALTGRGIEEQISNMQQFAQANSLHVEETFAEVKSAIKSRPQFEQMLGKVVNGDINGILCVSLDRLCRDFKALHVLMQLMEQKGLEVLSDIRQ